MWYEPLSVFLQELRLTETQVNPAYVNGSFYKFQILTLLYQNRTENLFCQ